MFLTTTVKAEMTSDQSKNVDTKPDDASNCMEKIKNAFMFKWSTTKIVENLFHQHGLFVSRHRMKFLLIPPLIAMVLCFGILTIKIEYNIHFIFTPTNARSNQEFKVLTEFYEDDTGFFYFLLGVVAKDGGSLLREDYRQRVLELYGYFQYNYTITANNRQYSFDELQQNHREANLLTLTTFKYFNQTGMPIKFTYPVMEIKGQQYFIGNNLRDATVDAQTGLVTELKTVFFVFSSAFGNQSNAKLLSKWADSFLRAEKVGIQPSLDYYYFNDAFLSDELLLICLRIGPFITLGFILLGIFACGVSMSTNPEKSKPWETITSIISVLLASGSSFGIIFFCGYKFVGTLVIIPILVLALGMDVTYITLRNWRQTDPNLLPGERLAVTLSESGPSIVITTLTNVVSPLIGCIGTSYGVYLFCLTLAITVSILFILQITFFAAAVAVGGEREAQHRNGILVCWKTASLPKVLRGVQDSANDSGQDWWSKLSTYMAKVLCTNSCRIVVCILTAGYWASAIFLCTRMHFGLTAEKLLPTDSPLLDIISLDKKDYQAGRLLFVIVKNPPNFSNAFEVSQLEKMVDEYESIPECIGSNATSFWLRSFQEYVSFTEDKQSDFNDTLDVFLKDSDGRRWIDYIKFSRIGDKQQLGPMKSFVLTVIIKRTYDWNVRTQYTTTFRYIADKYPQFQISTWFDDNYNFVTDQLQSLSGNTIQELVVTAVSMTFICLLFIPNVFNTICAVLTIVSINIGVFAYLTAWDVPLDPVSMTSILLSIGYSVDFTSHISFHYYVSPGDNTERKLASALSSIGLPMLETGVSTMLTVGCICFVPYYIEWVFFKSILLVVILGLLHGLIILPMFLAWIPLNLLSKLFMKEPQPDVIPKENLDKLRSEETHM